jgi:hypothetical protein
MLVDSSSGHRAYELVTRVVHEPRQFFPFFPRLPAEASDPSPDRLRTPSTTGPRLNQAISGQNLQNTASTFRFQAPTGALANQLKDPKDG